MPPTLTYLTPPMMTDSQLSKAAIAVLLAVCLFQSYSRPIAPEKPPAADSGPSNTVIFFIVTALVLLIMSLVLNVVNLIKVLEQSSVLKQLQASIANCHSEIAGLRHVIQQQANTIPARAAEVAVIPTLHGQVLKWRSNRSLKSISVERSNSMLQMMSKLLCAISVRHLNIRFLMQHTNTRSALIQYLGISSKFQREGSKRKFDFSSMQSTEVMCSNNAYHVLSRLLWAIYNSHAHVRFFLIWTVSPTMQVRFYIFWMVSSHDHNSIHPIKPELSIGISDIEVVQADNKPDIKRDEVPDSSTRALTPKSQTGRDISIDKDRGTINAESRVSTSSAELAKDVGDVINDSAMNNGHHVTVDTKRDRALETVSGEAATTNTGEVPVLAPVSDSPRGAEIDVSKQNHNNEAQSATASALDNSAASAYDKPTVPIREQRRSAQKAHAELQEIIAPLDARIAEEEAAAKRRVESTVALLDAKIAEEEAAAKRRQESNREGQSPTVEAQIVSTDDEARPLEIPVVQDVSSSTSVPSAGPANIQSDTLQVGVASSSEPTAPAPSIAWPVPLFPAQNLPPQSVAALPWREADIRSNSDGLPIFQNKYTDQIPWKTMVSMTLNFDKKLQLSDLGLKRRRPQTLGRCPQTLGKHHSSPHWECSPVKKWCPQLFMQDLPEVNPPEAVRRRRATRKAKQLTSFAVRHRTKLHAQESHAESMEDVIASPSAGSLFDDGQQPQANTMTQSDMLGMGATPAAHGCSFQGTDEMDTSDAPVPDSMPIQTQSTSTPGQFQQTSAPPMSANGPASSPATPQNIANTLPVTGQPSSMTGAMGPLPKPSPSNVSSAGNTAAQSSSANASSGSKSTSLTSGTMGPPPLPASKNIPVANNSRFAKTSGTAMSQQTSTPKHNSEKSVLGQVQFQGLQSQQDRFTSKKRSGLAASMSVEPEPEAGPSSMSTSANLRASQVQTSQSGPSNRTDLSQPRIGLDASTANGTSIDRPALPGLSASNLNTSPAAPNDHGSGQTTNGNSGEQGMSIKGKGKAKAEPNPWSLAPPKTEGNTSKVNESTKEDSKPAPLVLPPQPRPAAPRERTPMLSSRPPPEDTQTLPARSSVQQPPPAPQRNPVVNPGPLRPPPGARQPASSDPGVRGQEPRPTDPQVNGSASSSPAPTPVPVRKSLADMPALSDEPDPPAQAMAPPRRRLGDMPALSDEPDTVAPTASMQSRFTATVAEQAASQATSSSSITTHADAVPSALSATTSAPTPAQAAAAVMTSLRMNGLAQADIPGRSRPRQGPRLTESRPARQYSERDDWEFGEERKSYDWNYRTD